MHPKVDEVVAEGQRRGRKLVRPLRRWWFDQSARRFLVRWWMVWVARHQRCDHCGRRKHLNAAWISDGSGEHRWHMECSAYLHWRRKAEERLDVLDLATELASLTMDDLTMIAEGRVDAGTATYRTPEQAEAWNRTWRVMNDLDSLRIERDGA